MLGTPGTSDDADVVEREPATLQAIVLRAAPTDLSKMPPERGEPITLMNRLNRSPEDQKAFRAASPITYVSSSAPPVLLLHGDSDDTVPFDQSVIMEVALKRANVPVKLIRVSGGEHGPNFGVLEKAHPDLPTIFAETVAWLDRYLKPSQPATR